MAREGFVRIGTTVTPCSGSSRRPAPNDVLPGECKSTIALDKIGVIGYDASLCEKGSQKIAPVMRSPWRLALETAAHHAA
jgi:hypothetical protein